MYRFIISLIGIFFILPKIASAHCPLCTVGTGALAVIAASLGVSSAVVGIFVGAFALALGLWIGNSVRKQYIPLQKTIIAALIYMSTIIPMMPLVKDYVPLYINIYGDYGFFLNNTYALNLFVLGSVIGAIVVLSAKFINAKIVMINKGRLMIRKQGPILTFILLIVVSIVVQVIL